MNYWTVFVIGQVFGLLFSTSGHCQVSHKTGNPQLQLGIIPHELKVAVNRGQAHLRNKEYIQAFELLAPVLQPESPDYFFSPNSKSAKTVVIELFESLDEKGREIWEQIVASEAKTKFREAVQNSNLFGLDKVAASYPGTDFANKARLIAARLLIDQRQYGAAEIRLQRCLRDRHASRLEPQLTVTYANCLIHRKKREQAKHALRELHRHMKLESVTLAGQAIPWIQHEDELLQWIQSHLEKNTVVTSTHNEKTPRFEKLWHVNFSEGTEEEELLGQLTKQFVNTYLPSRTVLNPHLADHEILFKNAWRLFGIHAESGKRVWSYPPKVDEDLSDTLVMQSGAARILTDTGRTIQRRTWGDQLYAGFATDGDRCFLLDQIAFAYGTNIRSANVNSPTDPANPYANRLVAIDLAREGAMRWVLGDEDIERTEFGTAMFLCPPAHHHGKVYILADRGGEEASGVISLLSIDANDGSLISEQALHSKNGKTKLVARLSGGKIVVADNILICLTPDDYLFGIDLTLGRMSWEFQLTSQSPIRLFPQTSQERYRSTSSNSYDILRRELTPSDRWFDRAFLLEGPYCVLTSRTTDSILCFNIYTGEIVWSRPRRDFVYAGCIHDGSVLLIGQKRVALMRLENGSSGWKDKYYVDLQSFGAPCGKGTKIGNFFSLATTDGDLITINLSDGSTDRQTFPFMLGNLMTFHNTIISQSATQITALAATTHLAAEEEQPETVETNANVEKLLEKLGSDRFRVREAAQAELIRMGVAAIPAIQKGVDSSDLEVRTRSRKILEILGKDVLASQISLFLTKQDPENDLAGWPKFRSAYQDTEETRRIFAEMYRSESKLFVQINNQDKLAELVSKRCRDLQNAVSKQRYQIPFPTLAAMLFFSTQYLPEDKPIRRYIIQFSSSSTTQRNISATNVELFKRLLARMMTQAAKEADYSLANLANRYSIKEGYPIAINILKSSANGYTKVIAFSLLNKFGSKDDLPLLRELLMDKTTVRNTSHNGIRYVLQVRDLAMMQILERMELDPEKLGFAHYHERKKMTSSYQLGFVSVEKRNETFEKCQKLIAEKEKAD